MSISDAVRDRLVELIKERNLTINGLSNLAGVAQSTVDDFVKGKSINIRIITLKKLIDALDMTITDFFDTETFRNLDQEIK